MISVRPSWEIEEDEQKMSEKILYSEEQQKVSSSMSKPYFKSNSSFSLAVSS